MSVLRVYLFSGFRLIRGDGARNLMMTHTAQALLAYLLLYRHRAHSRMVLASMFWGGLADQRARNCLNTALWRLRQVLEPEGTPHGTYLQTSPGGEVSFNRRSDYWLDVAAFEDRARQGLSRLVQDMEGSDARGLETAVQLYSGELLEGFYEDWAIHERERLRLLYTNILLHLMDYHTYHGAYEQSLVYGQKILDIDPLQEGVHREMMRLYTSNGQRALAVRQYEICCSVLAGELGILPMEETRVLYQQIAPEASWLPRHSGCQGASVGLYRALRQLNLAVRSFAVSWTQLQRAIQLVEHLTPQAHATSATRGPDGASVEMGVPNSSQSI